MMRSMRVLMGSAVVAMSLVYSVQLFATTKIEHHHQKIGGRYIVLIDQSLPGEAYDGVVRSLTSTYAFDIAIRWPDRLRGFVCKSLSDANAVRLAADPRVWMMEEDFTIDAPRLSGIIGTWLYNGDYLWHIDRVDEQYGYPSGSATYNRCPTAQAVAAYMIDTGVNSHQEFVPGRVTQYRFDDDSVLGTLENQPGPFLSHGSWTASVLTGYYIGLSEAHVVELRVAPATNPITITASHIEAALRWIRSAQDSTYRTWPAVVSMSVFLTGWDPESGTLDTTVDDLVHDQTLVGGYPRSLPVVVSANNFSTDSCQFSPARRAYTAENRTGAGGTVLTIGGTSLGGGSDTTDYRWQSWNADGSIHLEQDYGSNGGACISLYAPACAIEVADTDHGTAAYTQQISGTSFSAPMAAAIAARYTEEYMSSHSGNRPTTWQVYDFLIDTSTKNVVHNVETPASWWCQRRVDGKWVGFTANPGSCATAPGGPYFTEIDAQGNPLPPRSMAATSNTSGAGLLYYNHPCP